MWNKDCFSIKYTLQDNALPYLSDPKLGSLSYSPDLTKAMAEQTRCDSRRVCIKILPNFSGSSGLQIIKEFLEMVSLTAVFFLTFD